MLPSHRWRRITLYLLASVLLLTLALYHSATPTRAGSNGRLELDRVNIHPSGSWRFHSGIRWESGRSLLSNSNTEYTNIRVRPLEISYAPTRRFQVGTDLAYSSNSANEGLVPDNAGLESADLRTKLRWNRNLATVFTIGYGLTEDVFPYGGDGLEVGLNFPTRFSIGPGTVLAELGYTINNGQALVGGTPVDWNNYFNYGLGYYYQLTDRLHLTTEIIGHDATLDAGNARDYLEFIMTPEMILSKATSLKPSLSVGIDEGSPSFGIGLGFTYKIGGLESRRVPIDEEDIVSDDFGRVTDGTQAPDETPERVRKRQREEPLVLPGELKPEPESDTPQGERTEADTPRRNPERAQELANRGREAFEEDGNLKRAIKYFKQAVEHDPQNVEILSNLGSLLYRQERYEEAVTYYKRALEADPSDQFSHLFLGITYYELDKIKRARKHLEKARSIDPTNATARRAKEWLNRIEDKS